MDKYSADKVTEIQRIIHETDVISLDTLINTDEGSECSIGDMMADPVDYESLVLLNIARETLLEYINKLPPRECMVIRYRFGFVDGESHTLDYIAKMHGVTRERIRQLETKALAKLKRILCENKITKVEDLI